MTSGKGFTKTQAFKKLQKKAQEPFDLTSHGCLESDNRLADYTVDSCGIRLLYGTQRINEDVVACLQELADECCLVDQIDAMMGGAVANNIEGWESEKRQVLHTSCRDIFSDTPMEFHAAARARGELEKLKKFLRQIDEGELCNEKGDSFTSLVHVGIGGSDLGPRAIYDALKAYKNKGRIIRFISNVDPDDAASVLQTLDLSRTLVCIVSKSGTTLETLTNEKFVTEALESEGLKPRKHCVAITGQGSPMDNPDSYLRSFYMFDYIGGRYSVTSMVGAVVLGFALGYEKLLEFLRGAHEMDCAALEKDITQNVPLMLALLGIWNHNFLGYQTVAVLPYSQALHRFPAHLQQCDMESNGKSVTRQGERLGYSSGPIVWGEPGTNGQHAFYQLLHQGTDVVPVEFIGFLSSQYEEDIEVEYSSSQQKLVANLLAQSLAMATGEENENPNRNFSGNRPNSILVAKKLTPFTMGALLALYEAKIVFQGFAWNINSFDQEGVQLGKVLAGRFLQEMKGEAVDRNSVEKRMLNLLEDVE